MRIIGGSFKGRKFEPPIQKWPTRPTTDFAREALFNILENRVNFENIAALDLFAGTGSVSFELVSRGCKTVCAIESFGPAIKFMNQMANEWGIADSLQIQKKEVRKFLIGDHNQFELIFADPPYNLPWIMELPNLIKDSSCCMKDTTIVIEHSNLTDFSREPGFAESRNYGQSVFSFFNAN